MRRLESRTVSGSRKDLASEGIARRDPRGPHASQLLHRMAEAMPRDREVGVEAEKVPGELSEAIVGMNALWQSTAGNVRDCS